MTTQTTERRTIDLTVFSRSAYALIGAADKALEQARELVERREELPEELTGQIQRAVNQLQESLDRAVNELGDRARTTSEEAGETVESLAARGEEIIARLRRDPEVKAAADDVEQATHGWKGAATTLRKATENVTGRIKAATTMTAEAGQSVARAVDDADDKVASARDRVALKELTKDELYEMATERDIEGRSQMSKQQLVDALAKS